MWDVGSSYLSSLCPVARLLTGSLTDRQLQMGMTIWINQRFRRLDECINWVQFFFEFAWASQADAKPCSLTDCENWAGP